MLQHSSIQQLQVRTETISAQIYSNTSQEYSEWLRGVRAGLGMGCRTELAKASTTVLDMHPPFLDLIVAGIALESLYLLFLQFHRCSS